MYDRNEEIYEAIYAGERALDSLNEARHQLESASNWGLVDLLGGNMVSGIMKHSRLNDAQECIEEAKYNLNRFRYELGDIHDITGLHIDIDGFLTFADFFFDGIIADVVVQSRINEAKSQVNDAVHRVSYILNQLEREVR